MAVRGFIPVLGAAIVFLLFGCTTPEKDAQQEVAKVGDTQPSPAPASVVSSTSTSISVQTAAFDRTVVQPGDSVQITYHWRGGPTNQAYQVFVHFVDASGVIRFQDDHNPPVATDRWQDDAFSYTRSVTVPAQSQVGPYTVLVGLYRPDIGRLTLAPEGNARHSGNNRYNVGTLTLRHQATVLAAQLNKNSLAAQDQLEITYHWQSRPLDRDYQVFVHVVDAEGTIQFQDDHLPPVPTSEWNGDISYTRIVNVPEQQPAGTYDILLGLYDSSAPEQAREELITGAGAQDAGSNRYQVGTLELQETQAANDDPLPIVSVDVFGALPNDANDDSVAIQTAIDSMSGGGTLLFPSGNYLHDNVIFVRKSNLRLKGYDAVLTSTDVERQAIQIEAENVELLGFKLVSNATVRKTAYPHMAVTVINSRGILIADNHIDGSSAAGIFVGRDTSDYIVRDNLVENTLADGIHNTARANNGLITGNTTVNTGDDGIAVVSYINNNDYVKNITILDNEVLGNYHGRGITVVGGMNVEIRDNYVENTDAAGILLTSETSYNTYAAKNVRVINNRIFQASWDAVVNHGGIFVYARSGTANTRNGVVTLQNEDILIQGNTIAETIAGPGHIRLHTSYSQRVNVMDNHIVDADQSLTPMKITSSAELYNAVNNDYNGTKLPDHVGNQSILP